MEFQTFFYLIYHKMYSITCIIQTRNIFRIKLKKLQLFHSKIKKNLTDFNNYRSITLTQYN